MKEEGIKRYFYNAIDVAERFAFSLYYKELNSKKMVDFYEEFKRVYPYKIRKWQNDNGHENMKEFSRILKEEKIQQLFSYPRSPKINGYIERYNRTLREEFINNNVVLMGSKEEFKGLLVDYLVYYNTKRPHFALNLKTPLQVMQQNNKMSHMYLTYTIYCDPHQTLHYKPIHPISLITKSLLGIFLTQMSLLFLSHHNPYQL